MVATIRLNRTKYFPISRKFSNFCLKKPYSCLSVFGRRSFSVAGSTTSNAHAGVSHSTDSFHANVVKDIFIRKPLNVVCRQRGH